MGGIRGTWNGARICEGPHGAQWEARVEARPKIMPASQRAYGPKGVDTGVL